MDAPPVASPQQASYHEPAFVKQTLGNYHLNHFAIYLRRLLGPALADCLLNRFLVGTWPGGVAREWERCTVYWQVDQYERIHAGKIIYYNPVTGKRVKDDCPDFAKPSWAHNLLGLKDFQLSQCLFGEHQLACEPTDKPVAIVESEKSAIIGTAFEPGYIWLACGGLGHLNIQKFKPLSTRQIVLYPDLGGFLKWSEKAEELQRLGFAVRVSKVVESQSTILTRAAGWDIADFLTLHRSDTGRVLNPSNGHPLFNDHEPVPSAPAIKLISLE